MNKLGAQLLNDYRLNKKNLFTPIVIFLIIDILAIGAFFIFKSKAGLEYEDFMKFDIHTEMGDVNDLAESVWYLVGMAVLSFAGFVMVLVALSIGNHSLNLEKFRKCEIFYRSQPVSVWQYALSKYIIVIAGPVIILLGIGIINLALVIPFIAQFFRFNIADAFAGLFVSLLIYSRSILVVGSIGFLISAIFKEKAFMKLVLILVSSQLIIVFSHFSLGTPMLDIFQYIMQLINPLGNIQNMIDLENMQSVMDFRSAMNARILLFNWHSALQIIASATFFVLAVIIYGRKEIN